MILRRQKEVVVLGMMSRIPVAGVVWQTLHYLIGLERLGVKAYYVEAHARTPSMLMKSNDGDGSAEAADFIARVMNRFDFSDRWAFHALHSDGRCFGMSESQVRSLYREADLIINLHGGTVPTEEHSRTGRLIYLETDPVEVQVQLHQGRTDAVAFLEPHAAFFTFGELYGTSACALPVSDRFHFQPTRQPVVMDFWSPPTTGARTEFRTIGNWRQPWRRVCLEGEVYDWSKHFEFLKFIDVPGRTGQTFELALSGCGEKDREHLLAHGWRIRNGLEVSMDIDVYRSYVWGSRGEFTVAKDQNVRLRTGWFSDRSATYLASGRPVITQETGFSHRLPTGDGLFGFTTVEDVAAAVDAVRTDPGRHERAAREVAREYFAYEVVLPPILRQMGVAA